MIRRSLAESAGHFWQPEEFENVANPYFGNLKHLQNLGHFSLTAGYRYQIPLIVCIFLNPYIKKFLCNFVEINLVFSLISLPLSNSSFPLERQRNEEFSFQEI